MHDIRERATDSPSTGVEAASGRLSNLASRPSIEPIAPEDRATGSAASSIAVICSAGLGFVIGAVFWHFIGFWGFVSEVVLKGPARNLRVVAQTGPACTSVALDRVAGVVRIDACPADAPWLSEGEGRSKGDLAVAIRSLAPKRWTVTVEAEPDTESSER